MLTFTRGYQVTTRSHSLRQLHRALIFSSRHRVPSQGGRCEETSTIYMDRIVTTWWFIPLSKFFSSPPIVSDWFPTYPTEPGIFHLPVDSWLVRHQVKKVSKHQSLEGRSLVTCLLVQKSHYHPLPIDIYCISEIDHN